MWKRKGEEINMFYRTGKLTQQAAEEDYQRGSNGMKRLGQ